MTRLPRAWRAALAALLVLAAAAPARRLLTRGAETPRALARRLFAQAELRRAANDRDGMLRTLRAAWTTDPTYVPAFAEALYVTGSSWQTSGPLEVMSSFTARSDDPALARCLDRLLAYVGHRPESPPDWTPPQGEATPAAVCTAFELQGWAPHVQPLGANLARLQWLRRAVPESPRVARLLLERLIHDRLWSDADTLSARMTEEQDHPFARSSGYVYRPLILHVLGRDAEAEAVEREGRAFAERSGTGILADYLGTPAHAGLVDAADTVLAAHAREVLARNQAEWHRVMEAADATTRLDARYENAKELLDGGRLEEALVLWDSLRPSVQASGSDGWLADLLARRGRTLVKLGRLADGERTLLEARALATRSGDAVAGAEAEHNLLHLYEALGNEDAMLRAGEAFLGVSGSSAQETMHFMANHDLGWHFQRAGDPARARPYFLAMVAQVAQLEDYAYWAGEYFEFTGDLDAALAWYGRDRAVNISAAGRRFGALARVFEDLGYRDSAIVYARRHDEPVKGAVYPEQVPLLPGVLARAGRLREAERLYVAALAVAARRGQAAGWAEIAARLASVRLDLGEPPGPAAALADSAVRSARAAAAVETETRARAVAGLARVRAGETERGLAELRAAAGAADRARVRAVSAEVHERLAQALAWQRHTGAALAEYARAADDLEALARSLAADPLRASFRGAAEHVSNGALDVIVAAGARGEPGAEERFVEWSVRRKNRGIVETSAGAGRHVAPSPAALAGRVPPGAAVLDYVVLDSTVAVLVVTSARRALVRLPITPARLDSGVTALLAWLVPRLGSTVDTARAEFLEPVAHELYAALLDPVVPLLRGRTRLIVVPDGVLHRVPFDALVIAPAGERGSAELVVDRFTLSESPSLALVGRPSPARPGGGAVVVGGPGDGSATASGFEIAAVARSLESRAPIVLRGEDATEAAVARLASQAAFLHIAAHARANDANPAFARLALNPGGGADGALHAFEIERLKLPGTLVVLSACATAAGRPVGGEGTLSLSRAFLRAGASGTVATLWPVGPATATLMEHFYRSLVAGEDPAEALRSAKLALRRGPWASPLYWAGFTLVTQRT